VRPPCDLDLGKTLYLTRPRLLSAAQKLVGITDAFDQACIQTQNGVLPESMKDVEIYLPSAVGRQVDDGLIDVRVDT
jgi:hypothetical protein